MTAPVSISTATTSSDPQGFVLSVGLTENDARRLGTSLERIARALQAQVAAMLPAAQSRVTYLPASGARPARVQRLQSHPGLVLDLIRGGARIDGRDISLSQREYGLLVALVRAGEAPLTRHELHAQVWDRGPLTSSERIVDVTVRRLRARLGGYGQIIRTIRGVGYRFASQPGVRIRRPEDAVVTD